MEPRDWSSEELQSDDATSDSTLLLWPHDAGERRQGDKGVQKVESRYCDVSDTSVLYLLLSLLHTYERGQRKKEHSLGGIRHTGVIKSR